jgi:hypothetical protein
MENKDLYITNHFQFLDKIIIKKRNEFISIIRKEIKVNKIKIKNILDIGSADESSKIANYVVKNLNISKKINSITNKKIISNLFNKILIKSITKNLNNNQIIRYRADLVISNATIEHVGKFNNQKKMLINISKLTKKIFFVTTPYRFFPIEIHTKIPLLHFLPKHIFRKILKILKLNFYSKEENLNLLSISDIRKISHNLKKKFILKIIYVRTFFFISNIILVGIKK